MKMAGMSDDIEEIKLKIRIRNLNEFEMIETETFYVGGNSWVLRLERVADCNRLDIRLCSENKIQRNDWSIVASYTIKLVPMKSNVIPIIFRSSKFVFHHDNIDRGSYIPWSTLVDPQQGYVYNGEMCKIEVTVKSSPLQYDDSIDFIEFIPIDKCCDASTKGTFRLKVNRVHDFVDVCSPEIKMKNSSWRLILCKMDNLPLRVTENNTADGDFLQILVSNPLMGNITMPTDITMPRDIKAKLTCKLVSTTNANTGGVIKKMVEKFESGTIEHKLDLISWSDLLDPLKEFIDNDSFTLEVCLEVFEGGERCSQTATVGDQNNAGTFICPICFDPLTDGSTSVTIVCWHLFCSDCIARSIQNKPNCPKCNAACAPNQIKRVFPSTDYPSISILAGLLCWYFSKDILNKLTF